MQALERRVFGPKSEKMPPPAEELRRQESDAQAEAQQLAGLERRRERAALREKLRQEAVTHHVTDEQAQCPKCGGVADRPVGDGKETFSCEYMPGYFVRQSTHKRSVPVRAANTSPRQNRQCDPSKRDTTGPVSSLTWWL